MTTEELKKLADLSDQVIKLKQLIKEMQLRVVSFENNRDLNKVLDPQYHYWDGKRSEASFITEKLLNIFAENEADEIQPSCLGDVISRFNSTVEKQQSFYSELKALLIKYDAELTIEDFGRNWQTDEKIVVDFKYDESLFEKENTGIIPQLVLGRYENGL
jgi:hypothetical protein